MDLNKVLRSFHVRLAAAASLLFCLPALSAMAIEVTGVVTNGTTHKPASGDAVVLIALNQRMQEVARAVTGANGRYALNAPDPGMHLIRVDHQGAAYFQPAPPNTPNVNVEVFDVAAKVPGITTEADVSRIETAQDGLQVTRSLFVKNSSNPPRTQFSNRSYEIYLPADAVIAASAAMGPGGMPVQASPMPLGDKGHYAFLFPLRPGETQFQITYHLPYSGSLAFTPRLATGAANYVVMLPKSMSFQPASGSSFVSIDQQPGAQTYLARNVAPSQPLAFTVSGSGVMPRDTQEAGNQSANQASGAAATDNRPGGGLGVPIDTPDPLNKYKWWILGGMALLFAMGAGLLLRRPLAPSVPQQPAYLSSSGGSLMAALKDELFAIETDRMQGKLSEPEYSELKAALELVLRRALSRQPA